MSNNEDNSGSTHTSMNVGIIGTGFGSVVQYPGFKKHNGFNPIAIAGKHESKTKKIATKLGIELYSTDWQEIVQNQEIDIISVVTPPYLHSDIVIHALEHGKHVLCEKPLANSVSGAETMVEKAEESGLITMVDLEFRYIPSRSYFVELIKKGFIGDIYHLDIRVRTPSRLNPRQKGHNWWSERKKGGGVLNALGSHYIDFILQIVDDFEEVLGSTSIRIPKRLNKMTGRMKKVTADDEFSSLFRTQNGATISLCITTTSAYGRGPRIEAYGNEGTLLMLEDQTLMGGKLGEDEKLKSLTIPKESQLPSPEEDQHALVSPFMRLLDDLEKSIKSGRSMHPNFEDGLKIQKVINAIRKSDKTKKWVNVDL